MVAKTSPAILTAMFRRFARGIAEKTGTKVSMRKVSAELLSRPRATKGPGENPSAKIGAVGTVRKPDANALGRWTNPGAKGNWFIPIARVAEVARSLGATPAETDALMMVRLGELADNDPEHDVLVCGSWIATRVQAQLALDVEEQAVLEAFRKSRTCTPYPVLDAGRTERVGQFFDALVQEHLDELKAEVDDQGEEPELTPEEHQSLRLRAEAAVRRSAATSGPAPRKDLSAEVVARRLLRSLRQGPR